MAQDPSPRGVDHMGLATDPRCRKMLRKLGSNFPAEEKVEFSARMVKINRRGKRQNRDVLITNKAIYNLMPDKPNKCKRRINIDHLAGITVSSVSDEFVLHVPDEYDYRFISTHKNDVHALLDAIFYRITGASLPLQNSDHDALNVYTVTKDVARLQTREERMRRRRILMNAVHDSDNDELSNKPHRAISDSHGTTHSGRDSSMLHMDPFTNAMIGPDDFEFLKVIGRGSFAKVMLVRKKNTSRIYAMKIMKKASLIARNQVEHTLSERKIMEALQHPFLMALQFAFQTETKLYFVLDYYQGGELFFHLKKRRRFDENESKFFAAEVGMALGHLHSLGIVYRDLKPENILLDNAGHICLCDFGFSKDLGLFGGPHGTGSEAHTFCGTPEYLAPETVMNLGHGKNVDWWSLGILLYELVVGIPPFYSQNVNEMYRKIQEAPLLFPPNLTELCKDLITKLLNRDPSARIGGGVEDFVEIQRHHFWDGMDWVALYEKRMTPPYDPQVKKEDDADVSNFSSLFTAEPVVDSYAPVSTLMNQVGGDAIDDDPFKTHFKLHDPTQGVR